MKKKIDASAAIVLIVAAAFLTFALTYFFMQSTPGVKTKFEEALDVVESSYVGEVDRDALEEYAIAAMVDALDDRWSYYLDADTMVDYMLESNNEYIGVGITVKHTENGLAVVGVAPDSPADRAGVIAGGLLESVDGVSVAGMSLEDAVDMVQNSLEDDEVTISIDTEGEISEYTLGMETIYVNPVSFEMMDNIGYVLISNFDATAGDQFVVACVKLIEQGAEGLVFDLRFNYGGMLSELITALDYLLPEGDIFLAKAKGAEMHVERSGESCVELPMAALVNSESYSAAEFFAAALQEYDWAEIVGEQTSGKGRAQITQMLSDGSAIHISFTEYFTPSGASLSETGVVPDIAVELDDEAWIELYYGTLEPEADLQLQAAISAVKAEIAK